ncbi:branched-chain amino acid ABC transporter permease [Methylopila henanensis]|uniref:Branched-chain amino acid ABC transporter permease n=1 Tax=Methylopila henanensis TaxID=873516 RepID=A0ABW4K657_9HYPH
MTDFAADIVPAVKPAPRSRTWRAALWLGAVGLLIAFPFAVDEYWIKSIALPTLIFGLAALGLNVVVGAAGQISMGQAAFMAVGAFVGAIAYGRYGLPLPLALLAAGASSALVGALVGLPSRRIRGLYLMVSTLAAQVVVIWLMQRIPWFGATSHGILSIPKLSLGPLALDGTHAKYWLTLAVVAPLTLFAANLLRSPVGRAWIAIREREIAAEVLGVAALRHKLIAFAVSGFYAGVAGALVTFAWTGAATIEEYRLELSVKLLGMIIIGGLGSVIGSYLGAAFIALTPIVLSIALHRGADALGGAVNAATLANAEHLIFGLLIVAFLIAEPHGLARLVERAGTAASNALRRVIRRPGPNQETEQ